MLDPDDRDEEERKGEEVEGSECGVWVWRWMCRGNNVPKFREAVLARLPKSVY